MFAWRVSQYTLNQRAKANAFFKFKLALPFWVIGRFRTKEHDFIGKSILIAIKKALTFWQINARH